MRAYCHPGQAMHIIHFSKRQQIHLTNLQKHVSKFGLFSFNDDTLLFCRLKNIKKYIADIFAHLQRKSKHLHLNQKSIKISLTLANMSWKRPNSTLNRPFPTKKVMAFSTSVYPLYTFQSSFTRVSTEDRLKHHSDRKSHPNVVSLIQKHPSENAFFFIHYEPLSITPLYIILVKIDLTNHPPSFSFKYNSVLLHITRTPFVFCRHLFPYLTHIARG